MNAKTKALTKANGVPSKALEKAKGGKKEKSYSGHYQEGRGGRIIQLSSKRATKLGMDTH